MRAFAASGAITRRAPPPSSAVEPAATRTGLSASRCASSARSLARRARSMSAFVHTALVSTCLISLPVFGSRPLASHCAISCECESPCTGLGFLGSALGSYFFEVDE